MSLRAAFGGNTGQPAYVRDVAVGVHNYSSHPIRQVIAVVSLAEGPEFILSPQTIIPPGENSVLRQKYSQPIALSSDAVFKDRAPAVAGHPPHRAQPNHLKPTLH
ncbi:hypothetical protein GCM10022225_12080 [Plantactinospora mayteni]|uniref:Uncharacterized protein n=1 Tax=Plantactinospora mayteni TaxID=566021 RepID=A0ABQ4EHB6_9ACTN|nr:hypothetical protein Pma05_06120 [Plantactinospora mayteni]